MSDVWKTPLALALFALLSIGVTAAAAAFALQRPSTSYLTLETRSRLVADYSADALARRLEPLSPEIIEAAADDEAQLTAVTPAAVPSEALPASPTETQSPGSTVATPTGTPMPTPGAPGSVTPIGGNPSPGLTGPDDTSVPGQSPPASNPPSSTATSLPAATATQPSANTPQPTSTLQPTNTPQPTSTPQATATQPTAPTATQPPPPTPTPQGLICTILEILLDICP